MLFLSGKSKDTDEAEADTTAGTYKDQKAAKQKAQAGSSHNWFEFLKYMFLGFIYLFHNYPCAYKPIFTKNTD
jgi:hypothetical protein